MMRRRSRVLAQPGEEREVPNVPMQLRRMLAYLRPYTLRIVIALIAVVLSSALSLVFPSVIQGVIDSVLQARDLQLLDSITLALVAVFLLRSITTLIETYQLNYVGERVVVDVRQQLYRHLHTLSLKFFADRRVGELLSRLSSDVTVMRTALTNNVTSLLQQSITIVGAIALMVALNWRLTLFILVLIPIIVGLGFAVGYYMQRISMKVQDEIAKASVVTEEALQNIREVKSFVRESYEVRRYTHTTESAFGVAIQLVRLRAVFGSVMAFLAFGSLAVFLWFGGREVLADRLTAGELIAFLVYGITVGGSFAGLVGLYSQFQEALGATKRVFQLMDAVPTVQDAPNAHVLPRLQGRVTLDQVRFSYDDRQEVLHNVSLEIAPGEIIALVGPSGAGKTTLFNLIPRFYDPTEGSISVDGVDLRQVGQASLREQIGIVPQETLLFGGTIRENILYGRLDASEAELIEAAQAANAHEFIMALPDQYETIVGERGMKLSGGQRQRVAIARAILKDPRILLLDEATSSLDNESEHLVQEALARLMQKRTTVIIAHRLSTIRVAHRIAVLDKGRIVELGSHEALLAQGGLYAKLYEMQFRDEDLQPQIN
jgi:subfamily B ATP-binding cassette protein MsbA